MSEARKKLVIAPVEDAEETNVITLRPGDCIVLKSGCRMKPENREEIERFILESFGCSTLFLPPGFDFDVLRKQRGTLNDLAELHND